MLSVCLVNEEIRVQNHVEREATTSRFTISHSKELQTRSGGGLLCNQTHDNSFCGLIGSGYFCYKLGVI